MLRSGRVICLVFWAGTGWAQWIDYPTPGTPRTKAGKPNLSARPPKTSDGKPDLSGIWQSIPPAGPRGGIDTEGIGPDLTSFVVPPNEIAPMLPAAAATYKNRSERLGAGRPSESCLPHSIPDMMLVSRPFKIVQNRGLTLILYEFATRFRQILSDGRGHPKQMNPAWFGYSIGKWDGDAFVVDTVGFNDKSWLDDVGHPHTDALHTIERFRRTSFGHMTANITIDDPKAYARPWILTIRFELLPDTELIEDICDNEKDAGRTVPK